MILCKNANYKYHRPHLYDVESPYERYTHENMLKKDTYAVNPPNELRWGIIMRGADKIRLNQDEISDRSRVEKLDIT